MTVETIRAKLAAMFGDEIACALTPTITHPKPVAKVTVCRCKPWTGKACPDCAALWAESEVRA